MPETADNKKILESPVVKQDDLNKYNDKMKEWTNTKLSDITERIVSFQIKKIY